MKHADEPSSVYPPWFTLRMSDKVTPKYLDLPYTYTNTPARYQILKRQRDKEAHFMLAEQKSLQAVVILDTVSSKRILIQNKFLYSLLLKHSA